MKRRRFFYLVPSESRHRLVTESRLQHIRRLLLARNTRFPTGGVKVIYQHCNMLEAAGYVAHPVHLGTFKIDWYEHRCQPLHVRDARAIMTCDDILVVPERLPEQAALFPCFTRVAFVQNQGLLARALGSKRYADFGFTDLLCCSQHVAHALGDQGGLPRHVVTNGIDLDRFVPAPERRRANSVLMLQRKAGWVLGPQAIDLLPPDLRRQIDITILPNTFSEAGMIAQYQAADIFLALGFPEGFALPPLEAMACGCAVVGFTGGGGAGHMTDGTTALVVPDGDVAGLSAALARVIREPALKEKVRAGGQMRAQDFGMEAMRAALLEFAARIQAR